MLLDMLAAVARKDYDDRRRRQAQGQAKAKAEGKYKGRPEDTERNAGIASLLAEGRSWSFIQDMTGCSRATVAKVAKRVGADAMSFSSQELYDVVVVPNVAAQQADTGSCRHAVNLSLAWIPIF